MTTKLKPTVKKAWLEALRSGKYKQGPAALHTRDSSGEDRYCCLGVLCEVAVEKGLDIHVENLERGSSLVQYDGSVSYLPQKVYDWASKKQGKDPYRNDYVVREDRESLSSLNDKGKSFNEIADLIETYL